MAKVCRRQGFVMAMACNVGAFVMARLCRKQMARVVCRSEQHPESVRRGRSLFSRRELGGGDGDGSVSGFYFLGREGRNGGR